jgi:hypothetical protein
MTPQRGCTRPLFAAHRQDGSDYHDAQVVAGVITRMTRLYAYAA